MLNKNLKFKKSVIILMVVLLFFFSSGNPAYAWQLNFSSQIDNFQNFISRSFNFLTGIILTPFGGAANNGIASSLVPLSIVTVPLIQEHIRQAFLIVTHRL